MEMVATTDEAAGVFRVADPRVFRAEGRAFCRAWVAAALAEPGVRTATVDLATATASIEFEPGSTSASAMAGTFAAAVRRALASPARPPSRRPDWVALAGFAAPAPSPWEVTRRSASRVHLRPPGDLSGRGGWLDVMWETAGVIGCRPAWFSDAIVVAFDPSSTNEGRILDALRRARPGPAIDRGARALNLAKAGGSFALTLVGIAVPGIPTLPFLVGTSYYLARSSPRLNAALLDSPVFGAILREWEQYHGLSPASKAKILGFSAVLLTTSASLASLNPVAMVPVLLISLASVYATLRIPGLPDEPEHESRRSHALAIA